MRPGLPASFGAGFEAAVTESKAFLLRLVRHTADCRNGEAAVSWNVTGPSGQSRPRDLPDRRAIPARPDRPGRKATEGRRVSEYVRTQRSDRGWERPSCGQAWSQS